MIFCDNSLLLVQFRAEENDTNFLTHVIHMCLIIILFYSESIFPLTMSVLNDPTSNFKKSTL